MKNVDKKESQIQEYIENIDPYKPLTPLKFDLRGYAAYLKNHQDLPFDELKSVANQFKR